MEYVLIFLSPFPFPVPKYPFPPVVPRQTLPQLPIQPPINLNLPVQLVPQQSRDRDRTRSIRIPVIRYPLSLEQRKPYP